VNVTISLSDEVARAARHLAVDRGMSLSRYVAHLIEAQVGSDRWRSEALERRRWMMAEGVSEGMPETPDWVRSDLHER
jgi:predicted transcriptional regulator